jgi:fermentation-respiration switch protein FrsA (DUF1100 family)
MVNLSQRLLVRFSAACVLLALVVAACRPKPLSASQLLAATPSQQAAPTLAIPSATVRITRSATPTVPSPTPTLTPTPTETLTHTQTFTPTPTPHPMSIQALRERTYPGSEIVIEQELEPGANYHRYYASYLSDGLKIYALLTVPDGEMPAGGWPAIVFCHGYIPPQVYRSTEMYVGHVDTLSRYGYIVLRIDYRGNDRSEGEAVSAYDGPGYTVDVLNAVASLRRFAQANPNKIGMWGHSMGGFLTLRAMVISRDVKAGVIWAGVVASYDDLIDHWFKPYSQAVSEWILQYGTPEQNPDFWNSLSANSYLADLSAPLQLQHGTADGEVPLAFSENLAEAIGAAGRTAELYTYKDNDHNIEQAFSTAIYRSVLFFNAYLK